MSLPYSVLQTLPPETYLSPECFYTGWDARPPSSGEAFAAEYRRRYEEGLKLGGECEVVSIATNATWSAHTRTNASVSSYEGIGYHRQTAPFWKGVLDSGVRVVVYRWRENDRIRAYQIQPGPVRELARDGGN